MLEGLFLIAVGLSTFGVVGCMAATASAQTVAEVDRWGARVLWMLLLTGVIGVTASILFGGADG